MPLNLFPEIKSTSTKALYVDGGVIKKNPSTLGGTVAWVLVENDSEILNFSSTIMPDYVGLPHVTNNITELLAAVMGMEAMDLDFDGALWTDSMVTYLRLINPHPSMNGVPQPIIDRMRAQKARLRKIRYEHLKGHPTKGDLERGYTLPGWDPDEKIYPVSRWNVLCDALCGERAKEFLDNSASK